MTKESFLEGIKQHYTNEIQDAYLEYETGSRGESRFSKRGQNRFSGFRKRLKKLMASAKVEGLPIPEFEELARMTLPAEIARAIEMPASELRATAKAA
jgi:hypothetical protein